VLVDDLDRARDLYTTVLDGAIFHETRSPRSVFVAVGADSVIELRAPELGTPEAESLERDGAMVWSTTFLVADLDAVATHLAASGIPTHGSGEIAIEPRYAFGARYTFTSEVTPGDPRETLP
jgi:hypothetical protein